MFETLQFQHPFRKYQRLILSQVESGQGDHRYHLVAPPGAGKTIVGLELIRRFGCPAVVFTPTTTIQLQWREKLGLFIRTPGDPRQLDRLTSLDPGRLAPVNIFTYQLIATPGESQAWVQEMARHRWLEDLVMDGVVDNPEAAQHRLATMQQNNTPAFNRELSKRYLRLKHKLLRQEPGEIAAFLHPNAINLIQRLVDAGVRTVVLDECHHLLDYWAIVLRYLLNQIDNPHVIGLTATLPSPEDDIEYENYTTLLGEVDFEVPTPAVVKEGDLAPYRDLVYFVEPTRREVQYLNNIQQAFENSLASLADSTDFQQWVIGLVENGGELSNGWAGWDIFLQKSPSLSLAALRFLRRKSYPFPTNLLLPLEAAEDLTLEDWAVLLERYGLDVLKISTRPADHQALTALRKVLYPFGLTLTERGLRQSRSPGDLVLSFSEAKDYAVTEILAAEARTLNERLRAVVITDFERMSSGVRRLAGILDPDAGSAVRVFGRLAVHPQTAPLCPVLVTGSTLMSPADHSQKLLDYFTAYLDRSNLNVSLHTRPVNGSDQVVEFAGEGRDWSPRTYVAMVTSAFEYGLTRCLIGTRGIFGEGWDSLALNTLIDLTSVTTSTSVQQLRGRSIRKDPAWGEKVAHNWDVICVAPRFERGDLDLRRFLQRHTRYWGIVPLSKLEQLRADAGAVLDAMTLSGTLPGVGDVPLGSELRGQIVKGIGHVSPRLAYELVVRGFKGTNYERYTQESLAAVGRRDQTYRLWGIGEEYSNFSYSLSRFDVKDLRIRTVYTIQDTLRKMLRSFRASLVAGLMVTAWVAAQIGLSLQEGSLGVAFFAAGIVLILGTSITFMANLRSAYRLARKFLVEQPPDGILLDVGRAILAALQETGLVSRSLHPEFIRVVAQPDDSYDVFLDYASPEDAALFIQSYRQVFDPVREQRYLILRDDNRLPRLALAPVWYMLRSTFRNAVGYEPAYHPVPDVLAVRKERAESFAKAWKKFVGGGELVFTRSDAGRRMLLHARTQRRPKVKSLAFEIWR